jgi:flagellar basal body-associated protein FliL
MKGGNMKERRFLWLIVVLVVLLLASLVYIGLNVYSDKKTDKENQIYQQGLQIGYQQAIIQIAQEAVKCNQVPLVIGNQTMNVFWVDCLNQQAQA